jgi:ferredoxin
MDSSAKLIGLDGLERLIGLLAARGFRVLGPRLEDDAVVLDDIASAAELPAGWEDEQDGGRYRLHYRNGGPVFGYTTAVQGPKRHLYPPRQKLFGATRQDGGWSVDAPEPQPAPLALIGLRACDLAAINMQGRVFSGAYGDTGYLARRGSAFVVAVECARSGNTCFCASMGTGPEVTGGFDIKLVEFAGEGFLAQAGSPQGSDLLEQLDGPPAGPGLAARAAARVEGLAQAQAKRMDTEAARTLQAQPDHPQWENVAARCLTCGNCTMVCPTCFCTTVEDVTDLTGDHAERWRRWDSCFTVDFSYIHGGAVRTAASSRYRQWITHKLSTWHDQFGSSGCVGCGRCITWCPVGIDITQEVAAIKGGK